MPSVEFEFAPLQIPRLAALATSAWPAWLWSSDASRILWANAVGAAIFGAVTPAEYGKLRFNKSDSSAAQIARLAASLPSAGQERLERLRSFGAGFGRALMCVCSRIVLPDGTAGVLVAATEPAGPALPLRERVRRLFPDSPKALAAFTPEGVLLHANALASQRLGGATTLPVLGLDALGAKALESGRAGGSARIGQTEVDVTADRLGRDDSRVLVVTLPPLPSEPAATQTQTSREPSRAESAPESVVAAPPSVPAAAPAPAAAEPPAPRQTISPEGPVAERRHPLRFIWQMDADGRFVVGSDEFIELVGPRTTAACGRLWSEIAAELKLDPNHQVMRAVSTHETWSGIQLSWPVDESDERLPVELSGLPVFDRDRTFRGYRGFGVCRDVDRINQLARVRRARPIGFIHAPAAAPACSGESAAPPQRVAPVETPAEVAAPQPVVAAKAPEPAEPEAPKDERSPVSSGVIAANVVPFRPAPAAEVKAPSLSAVERSAFSELAQELTTRLRGAPEEQAAPESVPEKILEEDPPATAEQPLAAVETASAAPSAEPAPAAEPITQAAADVPPLAPAIAADAHDTAEAPPQQPPATEQVLLDRVPAGVLVHRNDALIYANRHFLELTGYENLDALAAAGGLNALFVAPGAGALTDDGGAQKLSITTRRGDTVPVEGRLFTVPWHGASALALTLTSGHAEERQRASQLALGTAENEIRELKSNLERTARREAQKAAATKADFLARVSHEIRTPLNSMIGFSEVIMAERFGAIGNERYREYLKDIHAAGTHLVSVLNDLLDLSKIETGQLDLTFADVELNALTQQCVGIMQPQANRARIIIRSALTPGLPQIVADARSLRQIVLNLLGNAIKFTGPGGQVIVSTAVTEAGEVVLRVRDTGVGMRERDIDAVLDPFQQNSASATWGSGGSGLGLPLTKALAEANRANFSIKSAPNAGTLVEIAFPSSRMAQ
jgi:signal transduction histidine kinase